MTAMQEKGSLYCRRFIGQF